MQRRASFGAETCQPNHDEEDLNTRKCCDRAHQGLGVKPCDVDHANTQLVKMLRVANVEADEYSKKTRRPHQASNIKQHQMPVEKG